jgi:NAD-dependent SIR2 family protein deacetylase
MKEPIVVRSFGDEQYVGCTGCPADSHVVAWLTMSRDRPIERCPECGSVYKMDYVGPAESHDTHGHHGEDVGRKIPFSFLDTVPPPLTFISHRRRHRRFAQLRR